MFLEGYWLSWYQPPWCEFWQKFYHVGHNIWKDLLACSLDIIENYKLMFYKNANRSFRLKEEINNHNVCVCSYSFHSFVFVFIACVGTLSYKCYQRYVNYDLYYKHSEIWHSYLSEMNSQSLFKSMYILSNGYFTSSLSLKCDDWQLICRSYCYMSFENNDPMWYF